MYDYFELLSIENKYDIGVEILNQQYLAMQIKYHPDQRIDKTNNLSISIDLNKAYTILKDDLKRAEYMLSLHGLNLDDRLVRSNLSDLELQNIWNELEIIEDTEDLVVLENMYNQKILEKNILMKNIADGFKQKKLKFALDSTISLKYISNMINNIQLKIRQL